MQIYKSLAALLFLSWASVASAFDMGGIFGNAYIFKDHKIKLDPQKAYRDRPGYQQQYGPYGEHFIDTVFDRQHSIPSTLNNERFPELVKQKKLQKARTILHQHRGRGRRRPQRY